MKMGDRVRLRGVRPQYVSVANCGVIDFRAQSMCRVRWDDGTSSDVSVEELREEN